MATADKWTAIVESLPDSMPAGIYVGLILSHVCQAYCDYFRRIGLNVDSYPNKVFHLCNGQPTDRLVFRAFLAAEILRLPAHLLGNSVQKIEEEFGEELQACVDSGGQLCEYLFTFLLDTGRALRIHTGDVEGANNCIGEEVKKAPHISQESVSDRLKIRRVISSAAKTPKWSEIKPSFDRIHGGGVY